jgi:hypothetical protein
MCCDQRHFGACSFAVFRNFGAVSRHSPKTNHRRCRQNQICSIVVLASKALEAFCPKVWIGGVFLQDKLRSKLVFRKELPQDSNQLFLSSFRRAHHQKQCCEFAPVLALRWKTGLPKVTRSIFEFVSKQFDAVMEHDPSGLPPASPSVVLIVNIQHWVNKGRPLVLLVQ